ncbi:MAG: phosphatase PAP2 family protein [Pseudomonadales bacterium]
MQLLHRLSLFDQKLFLWLNKKSHSRLRLVRTAQLLSRTGDGYAQVLLPFLFNVTGKPFAQEFFLKLACALVLERTVYFTLKNTLKRRRPPQAIPGFSATIIASDEFSFPSGHTSAAFLLAVITAAFHPGLSYMMFIWAALVGLSRIALGVHFPADIVAGAILGSAIALPFAGIQFWL